MSAKKSATAKPEQPRKPGPTVSFYPGWCKRCGNCVAFCPGEALEEDEWGFPYLAHPERCVSCHMCEKLCPDFAISVSEPAAAGPSGKTTPAPGTPGSPVSQDHSPERIAPAAEAEED
jgi:2-oxoglutarate ferredoxin oxidoreductase subunit delta